MRTQSNTGASDPAPSQGLPWELIEEHRGIAFLLAGLLILASFIIPSLLAPLTDWAWASGLLLIGFAILAVTAGLFGLYPQTTEQAPGVAVTGALFASLAASASISLIAGVGVILFAQMGLGTTASRPGELFVIIALLMVSGFALGLLFMGVAARRTASLSRNVGQLLVGGGLLLLLPVVIETVGLVSSIRTPPWLLFPIIGVVAIDMLAIGHRLTKRAEK